jgi:hypothetical protein
MIVLQHHLSTSRNRSVCQKGKWQHDGGTEMAKLMNLGAENNYNKRFRLTRQSYLVSLVRGG